ncbi:uncharacterized protein LOC111707491 isoform X2 [Eurytemora carolleeae]|uniref:uncharacterized protein LOC111707491 isoform X2 n=1 Tax=Eurytemora carolleeae TaxID=1294199 RepID=UPI000C76850D|nr:uncharacterized protein LOC111707491 isoform X2 [Eurytemora carolleeae]|eukprot:XP_023336369.1 uncharacterized protein LOC111707491 isoform X2 [Eurytemora affinis]
MKMVLAAYMKVQAQARGPAHALLIPLAISDIILGIWSILNISNLGNDHALLAKVAEILGVVGSTGGMVSISHISLDRTVSIAFPFSYTVDKRRILSVYYTSIIITVLFTSSLAFTLSDCGLPLFVLFYSVYHKIQLFTIFLPCSLSLVVSHVYLARVARRHAKSIRRVKKVIAAKEISDNAWLSGTGTSHYQDRERISTASSQKSNRSNATFRSGAYKISLMATAFVFFIGWLPSQILPFFLEKTSPVLGFASLTVLLSSALNPFLYSAQNKEMREALCKLFKTRNASSRLSIYRRKKLPDNEKMVLAASKLCSKSCNGSACMSRVPPQVQQQNVLKHSQNLCNCQALECQGTIV